MNDWQGESVVFGNSYNYTVVLSKCCTNSGSQNKSNFPIQIYLPYKNIWEKIILKFN